MVDEIAYRRHIEEQNRAEELWSALYSLYPETENFKIRAFLKALRDGVITGQEFELLKRRYYK